VAMQTEGLTQEVIIDMTIEAMDLET